MNPDAYNSPNSPLSNREIMQMFTQSEERAKAHEDMDERRFGEAKQRDDDHKALLTKIDAKVSYTNGKIAEINKWRWMMMGGLSILSIIIVPVAIYLLTHYK